MASGTVLFIPPGGGITTQAGQGVPGVVIQPTGMTPSVQYGGQPNARVQAMEKFRKAEAKTLGAIQIVIALVHIGFASVSTVLFNHHYVLLTTISGYPFWGSVFFIISGSLSVSAEKHLTPGLVRCSVAMNIVSAIMSFTGIILYVVELAISLIINYPYDTSDLDGYYLKASLNTGLSVLLFLFSLLEFCITVSTAHFGCQAACCNSDGEVVFVPYAVNGGHMVLTEGSPSPLPPIYETVSLKQ